MPAHVLEVSTGDTWGTAKVPMHVARYHPWRGGVCVVEMHQHVYTITKFHTLSIHTFEP